jgi:imidazolonepropionase-like amidohydrolase
MRNAWVIANVCVVDVENGIIHSAKTVMIEGDRILHIGDENDMVPLIGFERIEGQGSYLMPGLIDAHVHYFDPDSFGPLMLANGVVLVRDMGSPTGQAIQLREALRQGTLLGPEMITTGSILDGNPPQIPQISIACSSAEQGRDVVRQQARAGVDQIKVYSDLDRVVYLAIVDEARRQGLKPVGHVPETISIEETAAAGQASCEHLFGFEKMIARLHGDAIPLRKGGMGAYASYWLRLPEVNVENLQLALQAIRASSMVVCPTVMVFRSRGRAQEILTCAYPHLDLISPQIRAIWDMLWDPNGRDIEMSQQIWPQMQAFVYQLYRAGVPLIAGTDLMAPGIIPGFSLHEEMLLWQEAGIPPIDVLRSATIVPARFFGLGDRFGTVAVGKTASLVLVKGNPIEDIRNAGQIAGVFLRGRFFSSEELAGTVGHWVPNEE